MKKIKVSLADDHELFRKSLASLLNLHEHLTVVHDAQNGKELIKALNKKNADIVLLDIEMPVMNGMETLAILKSKFPDTKVIILSMHTENVYMVEFVVKGANGFLTKGCSIETLLEAINDVNNNKYYFRQNISAEQVSEFRKKELQESISSTFTPRELEILKLICSNNSHKQIADKLFITIRTVDFHKANIYKKANTNSTIGLYRYALENELLQKEI